MKNENELPAPDFKDSAAFKKMEALASSLISEHPAFLSSAKIFKERAMCDMKERGQQLLGQLYQSSAPEDRKPDAEELAARILKAKAAFEAEKRLFDELQVKCEQQITEFVDAQLEMEAELAHSAEFLE